MRKPFAVAVLSAAWLVAGCATAEPRYVKPDATEAKAIDEIKSCRADAEEAMSQGSKDAGPQRREQTEIVDQCMKAKGYSRVSSL